MNDNLDYFNVFTPAKHDGKAMEAFTGWSFCYEKKPQARNK